jgi:TPR repeat protein
MRTTSEVFFLTEAEQTKLEQAANEKRDATAAKRLGQYFISKHDDKTGLRWMRRAADLGDAGARSYFEEGVESK